MCERIPHPNGSVKRPPFGAAQASISSADARATDTPSAVGASCDGAVQAPQARREPPCEGGSLDKLGKPCRSPFEEARNEAKRTIAKRRRSKWLTSDLLAELEGLDSPITYDRARGCCRVIRQEDRTLTSTYCRCRWCIVCNRIRTGTIINRYLDILRMWEEEAGVYMVGLTVPNVEGNRLRATIGEMKKRLRYCRRSIRETRGLDFRAIENWECTYNADRDDFHPHVHSAVRGKKQALALVEEHLSRWEDATQAAQDVRKWDGSVGGMKDLAKYPTKLVSESEEERPPAEKLDTIFRALYRKHLCVPVGFQIEEEQARAEAFFEGVEIDADATADTESDDEAGDDWDDLKALVVAYSAPSEKRLWTWDSDVGDWVDRDTGECLTVEEPETG